MPLQSKTFSRKYTFQGTGYSGRENTKAGGRQFDIDNGKQIRERVGRLGCRVGRQAQLLQLLLLCLFLT